MEKRRMREADEPIAAKQPDVEATRVAKELEQFEKANATHWLMPATAAMLKEQKRPQQAERV